MSILVSPLSRAQSIVAMCAPECVVSLLDPEAAFPDFGTAYEGRHLRLRLHDVHPPNTNEIGPTSAHIEQLLAFFRLWQRSAPLLIHCRAGFGRSTAAAFVAMCFFSPEADELALAKAFRAVAPHARPNEALVRIADASMQRRGRMHAAIADTGRGLSWPAMAEGVPFELPEVCQSPNKALHATAAAPGS
jgi:predicted protein tyrosine phosphatase